MQVSATLNLLSSGRLPSLLGYWILLLHSVFIYPHRRIRYILGGKLSHGPSFPCCRTVHFPCHLQKSSTASLQDKSQVGAGGGIYTLGDNIIKPTPSWVLSDIFPVSSASASTPDFHPHHGGRQATCVCCLGPCCISPAAGWSREKTW